MHVAMSKGVAPMGREMLVRVGQWSGSDAPGGDLDGGDASGAPRSRGGLPQAFVAALLATLVLGACTMGPRYEIPAAMPAEGFREARGWKQAQPADELPRGDWWRLFGDAQLDALLARLEIGNQNLRLAEAQYRQALALAAGARAGLFPTLGGTLTETRSRSAALPPAPGTAPFTTYGTALSTSWDADLWGRIRSTVQANDASAQASAADLESARLSARTLLVQSYVGLRVADTQRKLLDDTIKAYETSLRLTRNRYAAGVAARADVVQAETQLRSTEASAIDVGVQRAQLEHAIAALLGVAPESLVIAPRPMGSGEGPELTLPDVPLGLPSMLLERRPDIAAAERRMAAANAQIGVVQAAWFPALTLTGALGFRSTSFAEWFSLPTRYWSLGPSLAQTFFDGGLRDAQKAQALAVWDATVASYRSTVLAGLQQVEDNLAALRVLADEARVQAEAVRLARQSVDLVLNQYKAGTATYLNVVSAQATELSNRSVALNIRSRQLGASVQLIQALGGGWHRDTMAGGASKP
jgi:NodT family efflux transporter outer membrane factor (OMF) lipoprotein